MMRNWMLPLILVLLTPCIALCDIITLDFEGFADGDLLTTQFPGLTFTNAMVLSAGVSLNEIELPPHSGANVIFDNGGPISVDFATPILSFGAFYTYLNPLTISAFDAAGNLVDSTTSSFANNLALSGDPGSSPNEFMDVLFASGISSVLITGIPEGGSFVLDDVTFNTDVVVGQVAAPGTLGLIVIGLGLLAAVRWDRKV